MDKKRIIFIVIFVLAVIGIGYLMYSVFFKKAPETNVPSGTAGQVSNLPTSGSTGQQPTTGGLPSSGTTGQNGVTTGGTTAGPGTLPTSGVRQITQVVEENLIDPNITSGGKINFYNTTDGKFYTSQNGNLVALSDETFYNVDKVTWSPSKSEGILEYPDGSNIYYNFDTGVQSTLPKHWEDFSFSVQGDEIVAKSIGLSPENRWLVSSNVDGSQINLIEPLGDNADKVIVDWSPNKQIVGISLTGDAVGIDRQEVLFIGKNGENFKSLVVEGQGFKSIWSTTGNKLLYSVYSSRSQYKPELWVTDTNISNIGANRKMLSVNTWADKCVFYDDKTIYCAVPDSLPVGSGFSPELASSVNYKIVKIDTQTGSQTVVPTNVTYSIDKVFISPDLKNLYFTDQSQSGLFTVEI